MKFDNAVDRFQAVANAIQSNRVIRSITGGFMSTLPVLMVGAICALIVGFPVPGWSDWLRGTPVGAALQFGNDATINLLAIYVVIGIAYHLGREFKQDALATVITSMLGFVLVLPFQIEYTPEGGEPLTVPGAIPTQWLGPQGVFTAIIVAIVSTLLYTFIVNRGWKIRMPGSVPPAVSRPFEAIIPAAIVGVLFLVVRAIFEATPYEHMSNFIFTNIGAPLATLGDSLGAWLVIVFLSQLCWWFGIHNLAVWGVVFPIFLAPAFANQAAGAAGDPLPYVITLTFAFAVTQWVGGPGNLIGLSTSMLLFAKSKRYKTLGRLAFPPSIFNIIEPIMFGFPIVLNPIMFIPFILVPLISVTVGYLLMSVGIIGIPFVALPFSVFTMPFIPGGFILGAGVGFGIFLICVYLFSVLAYYPFFRIVDRRERMLELDLEKAETAAATDASAAAVEADGTRPSTSRINPEGSPA